MGFLNAKDVPLFLFASTILNLNLSKCHLSFSLLNLVQQLRPKYTTQILNGIAFIMAKLEMADNITDYGHTKAKSLIIFDPYLNRNPK